MDGTGASMDAQNHEGDLGGAHGESGQVVAEPEAVLPVRPTPGGTDELEFDAFLRPSAGGTSDSPGLDGDLGGAHAASSRSAPDDFVADFESAAAGTGPDGDLGGAHIASSGTAPEDFVADFGSALTAGGASPDGDLGGAHAASSGTAPDDFVADFSSAVSGGANGQLNGDIGGGFENSENPHQESTGGDFTSLPVRCHGDDPGSTPSLPSTSAAPGGTSQPHDDFFADFASVPPASQQAADISDELHAVEASLAAEAAAASSPWAHRSSEGSSSIAEIAPPAGEGHGGSGEPSQWAFVEQTSHQEEDHLRNVSTGDSQQGALSGWSVLGTGQAAEGQAETGQTGDQIAGLGLASDESTGGNFTAMPLPSHGGGSGGPMDCEPWGISGTESTGAFRAAAEGGNDPGGTPSLPSTSPPPGAAEAEDAVTSTADAAFDDFESASAPLGDFGATAVVTPAMHGGAEEDPGSTPSLPSVGPDPGATQSAAALLTPDGFPDFTSTDTDFADFSVAATGTAEAHSPGAGDAEDPGSTPSLPSTCPAPGGAASDELHEAAGGARVEDEDPGGTPSLPTTSEEANVGEPDGAFADFSAADALLVDSGLAAVGEDPGSTPSLPSASAAPTSTPAQEHRGSDSVDAFADFSAADPGGTPSLPSNSVIPAAQEHKGGGLNETFADFTVADATLGDSSQASMGEDPGSTPSLPNADVLHAIVQEHKSGEVDDAVADSSATEATPGDSSHAAMGEDPGSTPSLPSANPLPTSVLEQKSDEVDDAFADFSAADATLGDSSHAAIGEDPGSTPSLPNVDVLPAIVQEHKSGEVDDTFADFSVADATLGDSSHAAMGEDPGSTPSLPSPNVAPTAAQEHQSGEVDDTCADLSAAERIPGDPGSTPSLPNSSATPTNSQDVDVEDGFANFSVTAEIATESGHAVAGEDPGSTPSLPSASIATSSAQGHKGGEVEDFFADESPKDSGHAAMGEDPGSTPSLPSTGDVPTRTQEGSEVDDAFVNFPVADKGLVDSAVGEDPGSTPSLASACAVPASMQDEVEAFADFSPADPGSTPSFPGASAALAGTHENKADEMEISFADFSAPADSSDAGAAVEGADLGVEDPGGTPSLSSKSAAPGITEDTEMKEAVEDDFADFAGAAQPHSAEAPADNDGFASFPDEKEDLGGTNPVVSQDPGGTPTHIHDSAACGQEEDKVAEGFDGEFASFSGAASPETAENEDDDFADFNAAQSEDPVDSSPASGFAEFPVAGEATGSGAPAEEPVTTEFADFAAPGENTSHPGRPTEVTDDGFADFEAADDGFADFGDSSSSPAGDASVKPTEQSPAQEAAQDFFDDDDDGFADFSSAPAQAPAAEVASGTSGKSEGVDAAADDDDFGDFDTAAAVGVTPQPTSASSAPVADAGGAPETQEAEDDDFFADDDFGGFSSAPVQEPPSDRAADAGDAAGDKEDDWAFSSSQAPSASQGDSRPAAGPGAAEVEAEIKGIVADWCEQARACDVCNPLKTAASNERSNDGDLAHGTDWEDWLAQDAALPAEAQALLQQGVSEKRVPMVPFTSLGISATEIHGSSRTKVRDVFFGALGKHMTLQIPKGSDQADAMKERAFSGQLDPEAEGGERSMADLGSAPMMSALGSAPVMSPKSPSASTVPASVPGNSTAAGFGDSSLLGDADWGLFGGGSTSSTPAPASGVGASAGSSAFGMSSAGGDLLSQTFNDMGLAFPAAAPRAPQQQAPQVGADFAMSDLGPLSTSLGHGDGATGTKRKDLPPKVKAFLDGLPNLNHLWSPVIVS